MLEKLREEVCALHRLLPKYELVTWTSGNISARDPDSGVVVIKPSGVTYDALTPESMVVVDLDGKVVEGSLLPSVDTASHLYIYRHKAHLNGVVHTHSPYATGFAAAGQSIPVILTAMADEFGGPIPCSGYAEIGGEEIGKQVVATMGVGPAVLLKQHGVFTFGKSVSMAVKAAAMVESIAKTVFIARQLGEVHELPSDEVARGHKQYREQYGQDRQRR